MFRGEQVMQNDILSLKNIYRLITVKDYPIPTEGIAKQAKFKGTTLLKFWNTMLIPVFTDGPCGKTIWRQSDTRNRYLSDICNRSDRLSLYSKYTHEILAELTPYIFLDQILKYMDYLYSLDYAQKTLENKFNAFFADLSTRDPFFESKIFDAFKMQIARITNIAKTSVGTPSDKRFDSSFDEIKTFSHAWFLSMITLLALTGEEMKSEQIDFLRSNTQYYPVELYESYQTIFNKRSIHHAINRERGPHFVTSSSKSLLHNHTLPSHRFFGRETDIFMLTRFIRNGGHYLLTGESGIGKTELMHQFINIACINSSTNRIAYMDYAGSLAKTLENSFKHSRRHSDIKELYSMESHASNAKLNHEHVINALLMPKHQDILIIIDNVKEEIVNDALFSTICELPNPIILISKDDAIDHFKSIRISPVSAESAVLIFLDNFPCHINSETYSKLTDSFKNNEFHIPRTLREISELLVNANLSLETSLEYFDEYIKHSAHGSSNDLLSFIKERCAQA